jgi:ribosomal protein S18 acetylase RimI-like enzyme
MIAYSTAEATERGGLRRFELHRDLPQLADLIQTAFEEELGRTGNRIVQEMRQLARAWPLLRLLGASGSLFSQWMTGYVWIEDGDLVGNATLSVHSRRRRVWNISNVAVRPEYRGRGIARQLVEATLHEAEARGAQWIALEVRADNPAARQLYRSLGFVAYDSLVELRLPAHRLTPWAAPDTPHLRKRRPADWRGLSALFRAATPREAQELETIVPSRYQLSLPRRLERWLEDWLRFRRRAEWVLEEDGLLVAFLEAISHRTHTAHSLRLTVHPKSRGAVEHSLLATGLHRLSLSPGYDVESRGSTSHPQALHAFREAGFQTIRVLDQMRLNTNRTNTRSVNT